MVVVTMLAIGIEMGFGRCPCHEFGESRFGISFSQDNRHGTLNCRVPRKSKSCSKSELPGVSIP